ncbi:presenilins-associated rhomboid-like protein, mitochondrial [Plakobranchus ocellatus]|uniref:Presenilins-associated rhomboid-like protein, mitochondrial n=1 Tax=Plakobranchus ocellatus TaxID=259542 RepID=A0AAV3XT42_9GAST|nr:presenilins-associated rhomboid-like protein, mitochondrial [Plakobranchus ocellatus]
MLSVYLYSPAPQGVEDPRLVQAYVAFYRLADLVASVVHFVTGASTVSVIRAQLEMVYMPLMNPSILQVDDLHMEGIEVRLYRPWQADSIPESHRMPCIIYFHGGGWAFFSIDSYDTVTRQLSENTGVAVIAVQYRLAPEYPFPIPFDDCLRVTRHILHHGEIYQLDPQRVAIAGDSTGANLAAAVALRLREEDQDFTPTLQFQILIQPVLQALTFNTASYRENAYYSLIDRRKMIQYWCYYAGIEPTAEALYSIECGRHVSPTVRRILYSLYMADADLVDELFSPDSANIRAQNKATGTEKARAFKNPDLQEAEYDPEIAQGGAGLEARLQDAYFAPLMSDNVTNITPTLVIVGDQDIARDDGLLYYHKMMQAGVNVTLKRLPATGQGHLAPLLPPSHWSAWFTFSSSSSAWDKVYLFVKENL